MFQQQDARGKNTLLYAGRERNGLEEREKERNVK